MATTLTFGIELELVCVYHKNTFAERGSAKNDQGCVTAQQAIKYCLDNSNIQLGDEELPGDTRTSQSWSGWAVYTDDTVALTEAEQSCLPSDHIWEAIEITSPVFASSNDDFQQQTHKVLECLQNMNSSFGCYFLTNKTTGFHVHIAAGRGVPLSERTVKRVTQIMTAHERHIDFLHATSRTLTASYKRDHSKKPREYNSLSFAHKKHEHRWDPCNVFSSLSRIEDRQTYNELGTYFELFDGPYELTGHNATLNLDNLYSSSRFQRPTQSLSHTIEFRQHIGTLSSKDILSYTNFLCSLVTFCAESSDVKVLELLLASANRTFNPKMLLYTLGTKMSAIKHLLSRKGSAVGSMPQSIPLALQQLVAQNQKDVRANYSPNAILRGCMAKLRNGDYGLSTDVEWTPLPGNSVLEMLEYAHEHKIPAESRYTPAGMSKSRSIVFGAVARVYDRLSEAEESGGLLSAVQMLEEEMNKESED